ncbi:MAG: hypothetical protein WBN92_14065 [Terriglobia bacterium]
MMAPIAPLYMGIIYLRMAFLKLALIGILPSIGVSLLSFYALRKQTLLLVLLSHLVLVFYWCTSLFMIAILV